MQFFEDASELAIGKGEFHSMCCSPNIIRQLKSRTITWTRYVTWIGDNTKTTKYVYNHPHIHVCSEKPERYRCILEGNNKMILRKINCEIVKYIQLALEGNK